MYRLGILFQTHAAAPRDPPRVEIVGLTLQYCAGELQSFFEFVSLKALAGVLKQLVC